MLRAPLNQPDEHTGFLYPALCGETHLAEPIGLPEIAAAARLSPRGLQAAFRRHLDTTPTGYLRTARIDAAHTDLLAASGAQTVAEVAARWGFAHPGRFAAAYRDHYGETPAETLRR
ncbi:helix-turn-helix domain-containing protein [Kocuria sediminis]|uniref:Helix-turn-helix domain-containing protein n=1 Tax=Kocuria sediminis TaxID=1038857 RepID=A0A6N8GKY6_9MICC|nr:helix-turn-helix domain-containing protein [Kocuria sediminis]MUN63776.1 helix-turn-helix domain-containing protein [Kocuria sediminis]